ncbi:signal peptidase 22 kDa subunit [Mollisia scopiformis]|uniref:Signal peptidase subunit 3 n=1 Tax=Mollisia scopiformis TaxID=149040 RepID=A0A194XAS2_MOLSC|nr:signal peptidase 22 kDa subunit [Mollisia scopiformis]KUJ17271.1 signal peptidase 22 kDa subunit [Mollisia scopiformis]
MHSTVVRAQNVFGFFTTVAFAVAALIAFTDLITPRTPKANISMSKVEVVRGRPNYYSTKKEEYAVLRFNLNADFSSLMNWNTKQLFVYVSASWPNSTSSEHTNEAVIWDTIITSPSADHLQNIGPAAMKKLKKSAEGKTIDPSRGKINLKNQKAKYQITAPGGRLAEKNDVVLKVHYNIQPWVGVLTWTPQIEFGKWKMMKGGVSKLFNFPALKVKKAADTTSR